MREHHGSMYVYTHIILLPTRVWYYSDETNFTYIVEALQVKKPATDKVKSSTTASHDPPSASHDPPSASHDPPSASHDSASACSNSSGSASEAAQSVKELFPHLEIAHIEVLTINTAVCLIVLLLETDF